VLSKSKLHPWLRLLSKRPALLLLLILILGTSPLANKSLSSSKAEAPEAIAFDFDNTIINGDFHIYFYRGSEEFAADTRDYAEIRKYVGRDRTLPNELRSLLQPELRNKLIAYDDLSSFRFNMEDPSKSLRDVVERPGQSVFLERIEATLRDFPESRWQGPRWPKFRDALLEHNRAENIYIISSRGGAPESMHLGLSYLIELAYLKNLPPLENFYLVGGHQFSHLGNSGEERKLGILIQILDRLETESKTKQLRGKAYFADDDYYNFDHIIKGIGENINRWPNVEIEVEYVGSVHPAQSFQSIWFNRNPN
jgi:hypothetical protein